MLGSKKKLEAEPIHSVSDDPQYVAVATICPDCGPGMRS